MKKAAPCLADLVATSALEQMGKLYAAASDPRAGPGYMPKTGAGCQGAGKIFTWPSMPGRYSTVRPLIAVVETLRDITESHVAQIQVQEQANQLKAHFDEQQREAELARRILDHQIRTDLMAEAGVEYSVIPASNFSGDMVLAARSPSGRLYAILADATGHGLSAAVSVLPMVQEFYRLVELSTPLSTWSSRSTFCWPTRCHSDVSSLPLSSCSISVKARAKSGSAVCRMCCFWRGWQIAASFRFEQPAARYLKTTEIAHAIEHFTWQSAGATDAGVRWHRRSQQCRGCRLWRGAPD